MNQPSAVKALAVSSGVLYVNEPIVDLATRKRILGPLGGGDAAGADRLLDERLALYARIAGEDDPRE